MKRRERFKRAISIILIVAMIIPLLLCAITARAQGYDKYNNPNRFDKLACIEHINNTWGSADEESAARYFYEYTGLQIYYVWDSAYEYDDDYNAVALYNTQSEFNEHLLNEAYEILNEDPMGIVHISSSGHKKIESYRNVLFGEQAEDFLSTDQIAIFTEILQEPGCVIEDYVEDRGTQAVRLIVPKVMDGSITYDDFKSKYYYAWYNDDYDDYDYDTVYGDTYDNDESNNSWLMTFFGVILLLWYATSGLIGLVPILIIVVPIVVIRKRKKKKLKAEADLIRAHMEQERAEELMIQEHNQNAGGQ